MMDDDLITDTLETLEIGDTVELRIERESGYIEVSEFEVKRVNYHKQDVNGIMYVSETGKEYPNKYRIFVTDDGVFVGKGWSPSDGQVTAVAVDGEELEEPEYELRVDKDGEGNITKSYLVRTDKPNATHQI